MPDMNEMRGTLAIAVRRALAHLGGLEQRAVGATTDTALLRSKIALPWADTGTPPERVVTELADAVAGGLLGSAGGRFFAWVIGGALPAALAADWLTSAWDQNAALHACGPAAALVEETVGAWLKEVLGLPAGASFALVTGCEMAHFTCLAAARHALLARRGYDVHARGLSGAPPIRIITGAAQHGSLMRAARFLGLGSDQLVPIPVDADERLACEEFRSALTRHAEAPLIVALQAGEINTGAFDDFAALVPLAKQHGAWVHIDGAFGLWAAASPRFRHLLRGAEAADSWATDGHKWLNVPYDCGYAFVADSAAQRAAMSHRAPYLVHAAADRDPMDWNPEWSRRARGFATYAALRQLGRHGIADLVERCCAHAHALAVGIGALPGAELLWEPRLNQGLVRFGNSDHRTDEVIAAINASGEAFFGGTTWRGRRAMRISVCNWMTRDEDIRRTIAAVAGVLEAKSLG